MTDKHRDRQTDRQTCENLRKEPEASSVTAYSDATQAEQRPDDSALARWSPRAAQQKAHTDSAFVVSSLSAASKRHLLCVPYCTLSHGRIQMGAQEARPNHAMAGRSGRIGSVLLALRLDSKMH